MNISQWLLFHPGDPNYRPRLRCADGFTLSVQASKGHYCSPKCDQGIDDKTHLTNPPLYTEVEVGWPNQEEPLLDIGVYHNFWWICDNATAKFNRRVYGYVPIEVVDAILEKHGGIVGVGEERVSWK